MVLGCNKKEKTWIKLVIKSLNIKNKILIRLKNCFPNVVTEGKIDFEVLKTLLGGEIDDNKEKYQFTWKKSDAIKNSTKSFINNASS